MYKVPSKRKATELILFFSLQHKCKIYTLMKLIPYNIGYSFKRDSTIITFE